MKDYALPILSENAMLNTVSAGDHDVAIRPAVVILGQASTRSPTTPRTSGNAYNWRIKPKISVSSKFRMKIWSPAWPGCYTRLNSIESRMCSSAPNLVIERWSSKWLRKYLMTTLGGLIATDSSLQEPRIGMNLHAVRQKKFVSETSNMYCDILISHRESLCVLTISRLS